MHPDIRSSHARRGARRAGPIASEESRRGGFDVSGMTLQWKVFATNAAVLVGATLVLVLTPLTVSFPVALAELVALAGGLVAMLALNLVLLRRAFGPLARLTVVMRDVDPLRPGERAAIDAADPRWRS